MQVALFYTCLVDVMRPSVAIAAVELLEAAGCSVVIPERQTCCGQPAWNSGDRAGAAVLAKKVIAEFEAFEFVVVPSGACAEQIRNEYAAVLAGEPDWQRRAAALAPKVFELTDFLVRIGKLDRVPGRFAGRVTHHDSCTHRARARGAEVLYARDGDEICRQVIEVARRHGVKKITKSKSMLSEEAGLNQALEAAAIEPVETDLGEYILQINDNEPPSHIIAPVMHKNVDQVADLFARTHARPRQTDIPALTREAREVLRSHFLSADMGISGGNFLIAETGSVALVTNEGNGRMVTTLPRVHVVITGVEKIVPTLEDFATLMRLLPRSATGQSISNYVSLLTGTKRPDEADGAEHMVYILVDNGRVNLLGTEFQDMLRCIRCGACMNHCPVYQTIGGHAYGWVYPGPMGSVLTPLFTGIENALDLPQAATLCNQCGVVCPVRIPLPELLRKLRQRQTERGLRPWRERLALKAWAWVAQRPALCGPGVKVGVRYLTWLAAGRDRIKFLRLAPEWTKGRDFPAPQRQSFRERMTARSRRQGVNP